MINFAQKRCHNAFTKVQSRLNDMRGIVADQKLMSKRIEKLETKKETKIFNIIKVPHRKPFREIKPTNGAEKCQNN